MRVLAIDPGYGRCGMALIEKTGGPDVLVYSTCIETAKEKGFEERLGEVVRECARLIEEYKPDAMAMEKLFFSNNQKTAMRVAEVRGALISAAQQHKLPLFEYTPGQVKNAAAGWGGADKKQIATMLHALMKIDRPIQHDDEYDAIAIGVTHFAYCRN